MDILPNRKSRNKIIELVMGDHGRAGLEWTKHFAGGHSLIEWLPSDTFHLIRIAADEVAAPVLPHTPADLKYYPAHQAEEIVSMHIVVDKNIHKVGAAPNMDFVPGIIVVAGAPSFYRVIGMGHSAITAYVGNLVAYELTL